MPIIGILASGMSPSNYSNWMAYLTSTDQGWATAVSNGSVFSVGTEGTKKLIAKYNPNGSIAWQRTLDNSIRSSPADAFYSVTTDSSGNVYVGGYRNFAKYNSSGTLQWQKNFTSTTTTTYFTGIVTDSSGNIYLGNTPSAWQVAKLTSTPGVTWAKQASFSAITVGDDRGEIAIDSSGNVYAVVTTATDPDGYLGYIIQKFDSTGAPQWTRRRNGTLTSYNRIAGCVLDSTGSNLYASGSGTGASSTVTNSFWVSKTNSSGTIQFARQFSGQTTQSGRNIAIDSSDNIYGVGTYTTFAGDSTRVIIGKWNSSGTLQWQRSLNATLSGVRTNIELVGVSVDNTNSRLVLNGLLNGETFTMRVPLDGSQTATYTIGSYSIVYAASSLTESSLTITYNTTALSWSSPTISLVDQVDTDAASSFTNNVVNF